MNDVLKMTMAHWCPYRIGEICEFAQPGTHEGEYVPCVHLEACRASLGLPPEGVDDE